MARTDSASTDAPVKKTRKVNPNRTPAKLWAILTVDENGKPELAALTKNAGEVLDTYDRLTGEGRVVVRQEVVQSTRGAGNEATAAE